MWARTTWEPSPESGRQGRSVQIPLGAQATHLQDMEADKEDMWPSNEVGYTLIGHSERRSKYGETDEEPDTSSLRISGVRR